MAGGMRGVDVQRVEASAVSEDKQDIEDAAVQSSVEDVVDSSCKKLVELQLTQKQRPQTTENNENEPKTVTTYLQFEQLEPFKKLLRKPLLILFNDVMSILIITAGQRETAGEHHPWFSIAGRYVDQHCSRTRTADDIHGGPTKRSTTTKCSTVIILFSIINMKKNKKKTKKTSANSWLASWTKFRFFFGGFHSPLNQCFVALRLNNFFFILISISTCNVILFANVDGCQETAKSTSHV